MRKRFGLAASLLLSTCFVAPAALAQSGSPSAAPAAASTPAAGDAAAAPEQADVSAPGAAVEEIVVTGRFTPDPVRRTPEVVSVVTALDIARTGEGDIAGALSRAPGLSIVGGGFVYVRGLGDRYSLALLNGSQLPSPEPLRRAIPLDIFPTSVIASALVQKSYSANYPGEFGGGVINLTTRAVPKEPFFSINYSLTADTETTGNLGYTHFGSDTDWTGFDDGERTPPTALREAFNRGKLIAEGPNFTRSQIQSIGASLANASTTLVQQKNEISPSFGFDVSGGLSKLIGDWRVGVIAAGGLSNTWRTRDARQQFSGGFVGDKLPATVDFRAVLTDNRPVVNALLGFGAESGRNKIRLTNLFIRDTIKQTRLARGFDAEGFDENTPIIDQATRWFERQLFNTQLVGEFKVGAISIDLRGAYAKSQRDAPYERSFRYLYDSNVKDFVNNLGQAGNARVSFSELEEDAYSGGADLAYKLPTQMPITISGGWAYNDNQRNSIRRDFRYVPAGGSLNANVAQERPDYLLSDYNIYTYNILLQETSGQSGAAAYDAGLRVHAAYAQVAAELIPRVNINLGVRFETAKQFVVPLELSGAASATIASTQIERDYYLPAGTVTWNFRDDMQLRLNASKTLARPQFRELAFQIYQDPDNDRQFFGNPFLTDSELTNVEGRYEWFFGRDQRLTLGGFFKHIEKPIETFAFRSTGQLQASFANAPAASLYGAEIEAVKYIALADRTPWAFFSDRRVFISANYTYTKSELQVETGDTVVFADGRTFAAQDFFQNGKPLTGQSDHLINLQLGLETRGRLSQQTFLVNYASERVTNRGPAGSPQQPDIVEEPGVRLDFVAREGVKLFGREVELKFEARNITGTKFQETQTAGASRIDVNTYKLGTTFSLGVGLRF